MDTKYSFATVAIAGTFDRLHKGHEAYILHAFNVSKRVVIGITGDEMAGNKLPITDRKLPIINYQLPIKSKFSKLKNSDTKYDIQNTTYQILPYEIRKRQLEEFLSGNGLSDRAEIIRLHDIYGPAIETNDIEALAITSETRTGGKAVNQKRKSLGLKPLTIIEVPLVNSRDRKRISSHRIRMGEIDRWGSLYRDVLQFPEQISDDLRQRLKKPLGIFLEGNPNHIEALADKLNTILVQKSPFFLISVGDEVTRLSNHIKQYPDLSVVDFRVNRIPKYSELEELGFRHEKRENLLISRISNPPGLIRKELVKQIEDDIVGILKDSMSRVIVVDGEDDLAGIPAILLAPLGTLVLYGQPHQGVVIVEVTEEKKREVVGMIRDV